MSSWPWAKWPGTAVLCHHPDSSVCTEYVGVPWKSCLEQSYYPWLHNFSWILPYAEPGPQRVPELLEGPPTRLGEDDALSSPETDMCCPAEVTSYILGPKGLPTLNTYCPALSNICPGQINFPWYIEIGFLSKRKPHERKVRGHVHLSVLPILFAVGSRANTWAEATFLLFLLLTCTMYQTLCRALVVRFFCFHLFIYFI